MKKTNIIKKSELKKLYLNEKLSINQIAVKLGMSYWAIWKAIHSYDIPVRSLSEANSLNNLKRKIVIPKAVLEELYVKNKQSSLQIARKYGCHHSVILNRLKEHSISRRDFIEANTKYPKKNFDGPVTLKAYMLGFGLGDLNIRRINKSGRTLVVTCNSTIPEQIFLVENLFKDYGPILTKQVMGFCEETRIIVYLNQTFDFLLYKEDRIPDWVLSSKGAFFSFLAGYIDAEGHIRTKLPTYVTIDTYDRRIPKQIHQQLKNYGIICPEPRISAKKGYTSKKHTIPYKKDVWHLGIYSKLSLLRLFSLLKPYLKHRLKIDALNKSIEQINHRNESFGYQRMGVV